MRFVAIGKAPSSHDDGNVFSPQPHLDAVRGGWRNPRARAALGLAALAGAAGAATAVRRWC
jgi:hypothetical protein